MHTFGDAIGLRVVPRYPDVLDVVLLLQVGKRFDECRLVISDNFAKSTPSAQDVFKYPLSDGLCSFSAERAVFREMRKGAVALYEVLEAA